ncbi:MAG TPA: hypothetical protein VIQ03_09535 [Gammaproteobacteria bacterium]
MYYQKYLFSILLLIALPLIACADNTATFDVNISDDIKITIQEKVVQKSTKEASLPNGEIIFGATNEPKTYVSNITFSIKKKSYQLDSKYMYNAWGGRPVEVPDVIKYLDAHCYDTENCTIRGLFSDAGGSFVAEWKITNGIPLRTIITDSPDVVYFFTKNITPPIFD